MTLTVADILAFSHPSHLPPPTVQSRYPPLHDAAEGSALERITPSLLAAGPQYPQQRKGTSDLPRVKI